MVKQATLLQIAAGGFLFGATGLYLAQKSVQYRVRKLPHYVESLRIISEHDKARDVLGPPIQIGAVDLADNRHNYVGKTHSMLRVPVTGSLNCGHMDVMAVRIDENAQFRTAKIMLALQDGSVTIYDTHDWTDPLGVLVSD